MYRVFFGLLLLVLACVSQAAQRDLELVRKSAEEFSDGDKVAVLVGVSNYDTNSTGFGRLNYADDDMDVLEATLKSKGYQVIKIQNHKANKQVVLNKLEQAGKLINPQDGTLVFAFSGHGYAEPNQHTRLATYDTIAFKLQETGLSIPEVVAAIRKTGARRAMLFIDACRNDPNTIKSGIRKGPINYNPGHGIQILYSTRKADVSIEHPSLKQGAFSYFVNQGLRGKAELDGIVTFDSLAKYVEREVPKWTSTHSPLSQQPFRAVDGEHFGDFILSYRPSLDREGIQKSTAEAASAAAKSAVSAQNSMRKAGVAANQAMLSAQKSAAAKAEANNAKRGFNAAKKAAEAAKASATSAKTASQSIKPAQSDSAVKLAKENALKEAGKAKKFAVNAEKYAIEVVNAAKNAAKIVKNSTPIKQPIKTPTPTPPKPIKVKCVTGFGGAGADDDFNTILSILGPDKRPDKGNCL